MAENKRGEKIKMVGEARKEMEALPWREEEEKEILFGWGRLGLDEEAVKTGCSS